MNVVYGGAFNPLTVAHVGIINYILENYKNSKVIVVPVGNDYKKDELIDFKDRFKILQREFKNNKRVIVSNLESKMNFSGTVNTLDKLSEKYSDLHLLVGSDNIINLNKWIEYERLLSNYPLLIVTRNNVDIDKEMNKYKYLNVKYDIIKIDIEVNSTLIRQNVLKYKMWLTDQTFNYIKENNLYGVDEDV